MRRCSQLEANTMAGVNSAGSDYAGMLQTQMQAQQEAEKYQLASTLASLRHDTISGIIRNIK
jgi:hypothetical protein